MSQRLCARVKDCEVREPVTKKIIKEAFFVRGHRTLIDGQGVDVNGTVHDSGFVRQTAMEIPSVICSSLPIFVVASFGCSARLLLPNHEYLTL